MQHWRHYELAFDQYLRTRRVPYVCIDEARRLLVPTPEERATRHPGLKYFDFLVYGAGGNLLVELKGRRVSAPMAITPKKKRRCDAERVAALETRLECWTTLGDVHSLERWQGLFGPGFESVMVFVYWCDDEPAQGLFDETFAFQSRWYGLRAVRIDDYRAHMKVRSPSWGTVDMPRAVFDRISVPFAPASPFPLEASRELRNTLVVDGSGELAVLDADGVLRAAGLS